MTRKLTSWIHSYEQYASITEAPKHMHFWVGVGTIAGALRRKVWIDMVRFQWYPSFYIILVAPPGVVSKTTTIDTGMKLLREVEGINFGPDVITWQSLVQTFAASGESFEYDGAWYPMSAITLASGELGNLINPQDREMLNVYITLWDGIREFNKKTKMSGNDTVSAPWINMLGCTTPHWIADNMPAAAVGGGFTSRCIFVYADTKERLIAYVDSVVDEGDPQLRQALVDDLREISSTLTGPFKLSPAARKWGTEWYETFWTYTTKTLNNKLMEGYAARKQTHMHKVAMVLSASRGNSMIIESEDLQTAEVMLQTIEPDMVKVFEKIGRTEMSLQAEHLREYIKSQGTVEYYKGYQFIHSAFPDFREFEAVVSGLVRAGYIEVSIRDTESFFIWKGE